MRLLVLPVSPSISLIVTLTLYKHLFLSDRLAWYYAASAWSIFLVDLCLHTHSQKLCYVIAQITLEILFIFTPKGSSALGPLTDDTASAFVYL